MSSNLEARDGPGSGSEQGSEDRAVFEYFGWVYHLGVNSIGREYCNLRFLLIRGKYLEMYKRDPHENPDMNYIRRGVVSSTLMVEDLGRKKVNNGDVYVLRFYNETKKGKDLYHDCEIAFATLGEAQKWMEAFDQAKQQAEYELSKGFSTGKDATDDCHTSAKASINIKQAFLTMAGEIKKRIIGSSKTGEDDVSSLATDKMEDFDVGEFDKNSNTDSITRLLSDLASEKPQPYSHAQLTKFTKEFSDLVGSGGFGDVYKGEFPNGTPIAVKLLKNSRPELMEKQFAAEISTMGRTYHRNLIKLYGYCYDADTKALIYEYMEKGALDVILKNNHDMVKLHKIAIEIAHGISYLHESCSPQIIHHDLKPANVLLDSNFSPRIIDFGLSRLNMEKSQFAHTGLRGTRGYVAPEMTQLELGMISCKCDVFSFGMILFDILKSKMNYADQRWLPGQVWEKFKENKLDSFLEDHGIKEDDKANAKTLSVVALMCAEYNPRKRPSMSTVVKILEGEITPRPPVNPFPFYDSSSDISTTYD